MIQTCNKRHIGEKEILFQTSRLIKSYQNQINLFRIKFL